MPYALAFGMGFTLTGLLLLSIASTFGVLLLGAAVVGLGSSVFHPESSRVARVASGGRHGFAQSLFQVGGNAGSALGPLAAAFIVLPNGQGSVAWFALAAMLGIALLTKIGGWYSRQTVRLAAIRKSAHHALVELPRDKVVGINKTATGYRLPTEAEWEWAARTSPGTSDTRGTAGPSNSTEVSRGTTDRIPGIPANEATAAAHETQQPRCTSYSRRSPGDSAPSTYAASQSR